METIKTLFLVPLLCLVCAYAAAEDLIKLPQPKFKGSVSVEEAIHGRRSVRDFSSDGLTLEEVSQILWAAGGITVDGMTGPTRAYPSAGACYPLEVYLVAGSVKGLAAGIYRYVWERNALELLKKGDLRNELSRACHGQAMMADAPASLVVTAIEERSGSRYGKRGVEKYVPMDAGHLGQNVHLEAYSLGLGTCMVGAFSEEAVANVLGIKDRAEVPVYVMPVGKEK